MKLPVKITVIGKPYTDEDGLKPTLYRISPEMERVHRYLEEKSFGRVSVYIDYFREVVGFRTGRITKRFREEVIAPWLRAHLTEDRAVNGHLPFVMPTTTSGGTKRMDFLFSLTQKELDALMMKSKTTVGIET